MFKPSHWLADVTAMSARKYWLYAFLTLGVYPFIFRRRLCHHVLDLIHYDISCSDYPDYTLIAYPPLPVVGTLGFLVFAPIGYYCDYPPAFHCGLGLIFIAMLATRIWAYRVRETLIQYYPTAYSISLKINRISLFFFPVTTLVVAINSTK